MDFKRVNVAPQRNTPRKRYVPIYITNNKIQTPQEFPGPPPVTRPPEKKSEPRKSLKAAQGGLQRRATQTLPTATGPQKEAKQTALHGNQHQQSL